MKRKLLRQIANEWKVNFWMGLELLIVSVILWWVADSLYVRERTLREPLGFDITDTFELTFRMTHPSAPDYDPDRSSGEAIQEDLQTLMDRLAARPEIEAVAMGMNAHPYNGSKNGDRLRVDTFISPEWTLVRDVTPDFVRVFRYRGNRGETPEQLAEMLRTQPRTILISESLFGPDMDIDRYRDSMVYCADWGEGDPGFHIGSWIVTPRYMDFQSAKVSGSFLRASDKYLNRMNELMVRVTPGSSEGFAEAIMRDSEGSLRVGNIFIAGVESFESIRDTFQRYWYRDLNTYYVGLGFLLLNIFLGIFGTFWFRTQQRVHEIAIRKVNGASAYNIFSRVIGEGQLLLLIVTPLAILADWGLRKLELSTLYADPVLPFWTCVVIAWALMALMILLGVLVPAWRALRVAPAQALKDE